LKLLYNVAETAVSTAAAAAALEPVLQALPKICVAAVWRKL